MDDSFSLIFMLEPPDLPDRDIISCLRNEYGLKVEQVEFLPLGADFDTAVYRATTNKTHYFLKLRKGAFDETSVTLPKFLSERGVQQIISPIASQTGKLWGGLHEYKTILYPYVNGRNAYELTLSKQHWHDLGLALKKIHTVNIPTSIKNYIREETYAPERREIVERTLVQIENAVFDDPIAVKVAAFLKSKHNEILDLVERAARLAELIKANPPPSIVCHSDLHAGNIFIDEHNALFVVDWDEPILAPKERDLMYIGGGLMGNGRSPQEEETLFYRAYGQIEINTHTLAYYRYERIVQDIAEYIRALLWQNDGGADREQSFQYLTSNFLPNRTIEIAYKADKTFFANS